MRVSAQFVRFCAVGMTCYLLGLALLASLTELVGLHYLASFAISFVVTGVIGFWLNGRFSFGGEGASDRSAVVRYLMVNGGSLLLNSAALAALVEIFGIWYVAAVVVLTAINVPINFIAHRVVTYRVNRASTAPSPH